MNAACGLPPGPPFEAVLFDLDGTLIDSRPGIVGSLQAALRVAAVPIPAEEVLASHIGPPLPVGLEALGVPAGRVDEAIVEYRRAFAAIGAAGAVVHRGIVALLRALDGAGVALAVATSKPTGTAHTVLAQQELAGFFPVVCGADLDERNSSKGTVIAAALAALGAPPGPGVVMVGDRSHDVLGARANGVDAVGVAWGFAAPGELASCAPRWQAATVAELHALLLAEAP